MRYDTGKNKNRQLAAEASKAPYEKIEGFKWHLDCIKCIQVTEIITIENFACTMNVTLSISQYWVKGIFFFFQLHTRPLR